MTKPFIIVKADFTLHAWKDPWGGDIAAYVVQDEVTVQPTDELHHYSNGYTKQDGKVFASVVTGERCFAYATIDYSGSTHYPWLDGERSGIYNTPSKSRKYVRNGEPHRWDPALGWLRPLEVVRA